MIKLFPVFFPCCRELFGREGFALDWFLRQSEKGPPSLPCYVILTQACPDPGQSNNDSHRPNVEPLSQS